VPSWESEIDLSSTIVFPIVLKHAASRNIIFSRLLIQIQDGANAGYTSEFYTYSALPNEIAYEYNAENITLFSFGNLTEFGCLGDDWSRPYIECGRAGETILLQVWHECDFPWPSFMSEWREDVYQGRLIESYTLCYR
jgi:hypothetical protein